jgi:TonB family protein
MSLRCLVFSSKQEMIQPIWPVLADLGIEGEYCGNARDAVDKVNTQSFHIVITDWDDQPEAGILLKSAREQKAAHRPLTLAIVNDDARLSEALQAGANSVLLKPIRAEQVRDTLGTACELLRSKQGAAAAKAAAPSGTPAKPSAPAAPVAPAAVRPIPRPIVFARRKETTLHAGEFLSSSASAPGTHFDTESDVQKSLDQASAAEVDALTELEPMASSVVADPAAEPLETQAPPAGLTGWASLQERLAKAPALKPKESSNSELLAYGETPSFGSAYGAAPAKAPETQPSTEIAATKPVKGEADREAALFAYMEGEEKPEADSQEETPRRRNHLLVLGIAAAAILLAVAIPQSRLGLQRVFRKATGAGKVWLNPQPVPVSPVATQHETFGQDSDEYKFPQATGNVPDSSTDPSQIHVVPVVDPTAKPAKGPEGNGGTSTPPDANNQGQTANDAAPSQSTGSPVKEQTASATGTAVPNPAALTPSPGPSAIQLQTTQSEPARPPAVSAPVTHSPTPAPSASTPIPSSLRSQLASSTPDASGNKPVEAAMSSIEPVNLPEPAVRSLLSQQPADPLYPDSAKASGQHGSVVLMVLIGRDGTVQDARFMQGSLVFARAAIEAVKQWHFAPYTMNGRPVSVQGTITLNFKPPA